MSGPTAGGALLAARDAVWSAHRRLGTDRPHARLCRRIIIVDLPTAAVGSGYEYALQLPNQLTLLGLTVRLQAYAFAPGVNPAQKIVSNRLDWRIGDV